MRRLHRLPHDWYPATLPVNVEIGDRSWLYSSYAFLHYRSQQPCGVRVGQDTGIYIGTYFDLGPNGSVEIGNYCTLNGATFAGDAQVRIGDFVLIAREVVISDSAIFIPAPSRESGIPPPRPATGASRHVEIDDDAWIGTGATLLPGAHVGRGAIVGAAAVVDFEVPPFAIAAGNPARIVGWAPPGRE